MMLASSSGSCTLRAFEDGVLKRRFGSKGEEVTGECRKFHNESLLDL
jgi:hypothetical protein